MSWYTTIRRAFGFESPPNVSASVQEMRADYDAAKESRFNRTRIVPTYGAGANYHIRNEWQYFKIVESAWDMIRNDAIINTGVSKAIWNQTGTTVDPSIDGDKTLCDDIRGMFDEWANDRNKCDMRCEASLRRMEHMVGIADFVAGDEFAVLTNAEDGRFAVNLMESQQCRTPQIDQRNVVHGVRLDQHERHVGYYFTSAKNLQPFQLIERGSEQYRPTYDDNGERVVLQVYDHNRCTLTRGVSILAPCFTETGMFQDINFANLLRQQMASSVVFMPTAEQDAALCRGQMTLNTIPEGLGPAGTETHADGSIINTRGIGPGAMLPQRVDGFSPNIPNPEFFQQARLILQIIASTLGIPLNVLLLDASDTNFSGFRGAFEQAKKGFRYHQQRRGEQFISPVYRWWLRNTIATNRAIREAYREHKDGIFRHTLNYSAWPYIQPEVEAKAAVVRMDSYQTSPRRLHRETFSTNFDDVAREIAEDNAWSIETCQIEADKLNARFGASEGWVPVTWRDVMTRGMMPNANAAQPIELETEPAGKSEPKRKEAAA